MEQGFRSYWSSSGISSICYPCIEGTFLGSQGNKSRRESLMPVEGLITDDSSLIAIKTPTLYRDLLLFLEEVQIELTRPDFIAHDGRECTLFYAHLARFVHPIAVMGSGVDGLVQSAPS